MKSPPVASRFSKRKDSGFGSFRVQKMVVPIPRWNPLIFRSKIPLKMYS
jgi:hypothetical protein